VRLSREAASWAPFVALAAAFVAPGGRLAMVIPREAQAVNYAQPLLEFLRERFGHLSLVPVPGLPFNALQKVSLLVAGETRTPRRTEPAKTVLEKALKKCTPLDSVARVRLGIVTGAKEFFVLRRDDERAAGLKRHLVPVVSSPSRLRGLTTRPEDCDLLLRVRHRPDPALRRYLKVGEDAGVAARYKCRIRSPWYAVPEQKPPEAFLSYLAGEIPRLALNGTRARATNNLHVVRWDSRPHAWTLAFHNWLTMLSVEQIGRVYGGGVIKVEPGDAPRIFVPSPPALPSRLFARTDRLFRRGQWKEAVTGVSEWILPKRVALAARAEWQRLRALR
jgi:hypothetical protein